MQQKQLIAIILVIVVVAAAAVGAVLLLKGGSSGDTKYTVTYNTNGGNEIAAKEFTKNSDTFDLAIPTKDGSTFLGWYLNADFSGDKITQVAKGTEKNITVYAKWQLNLANNTLPDAAVITANTDVKVTFDSGASDKTIPAAAVNELKAGKTLEVEDTVNKLTWTMSGSDSPQAVCDVDTTVTPDTSLLASEKKITLDFAYDGTLPYESTIRYFIGTDVFPAGTLISIQNSGEAEPIGQFPVDAEGYVTFTITHCSDWVLTQYITLTLDGNGGTFTISEQTVATTTVGGNYNSDVPVLPVPSRTGYGFDPWVSPVKFTEDATLTAQWTAYPYQVVFNKNSDAATGTMAAQDMTYDVETTLTANAFANEGHSFAGWATSADGAVVYTDGQAVKNLTDVKEGTVNLYAKWTVNQYNAVVAIGSDATRTNLPAGWIDNNNGSFTKAFDYGTAGADIIADFGSTAENTTKTGATFNKIDCLQPTMGIEGMFLAAFWDANTYSVHFNANGGNGSMENQVFEYGTSQNLTANAFTKNDAAFNGWATSASGNVVYADQASVNNLTAVNNAVIDLYAVWGPYNIVVTITLDGNAYENQLVTAKKDNAGDALTLAYEGNGNYACRAGILVSSSYTIYVGNKVVGTVQTSAQGSGTATVQYFSVTFNSNGGTPVDEIVNVLNGDTVAEPGQNDFAKTGYHVTGWKNGDVAWNFSTAVTETTVLTAQWAKNTYTVVFNKNAQAATGTMDGETMVFDEDKALTSNAFALEGYNFAGWALSADGQVAFTNGQSVRNLTDENNSEVTLFAKWDAKRYTLTFNANSGTVSPESKTVIYGEAYGELPTASRAGANFAGWNTAANGSGDSVTSETACNGQNLIIYAQWQLISYTITYELDGGTNAQSNPATYTVEDSVTFAEATKNGSAFLGWFDAATGGNAVTQIVQGSCSNITVYAHWGNNYMDVDFKIDGTTAIFFEDSSVVTAHKDQNSAVMTRGTGDMRYRFHLESTEDFPIVNGDYVIKRDGVQVGTVTVSGGHGATIVNYYTTTFYANLTIFTSQIILSGGVAVAPQEEPQKTGYSFSAWMKDGAAYDFATPVTGVQSLTAAFTANQYTVTFNPANGQQSTQLTVTYASEIQDVAVPQNSGYTFEGYFLGNTQYFDALGKPIGETWLITENCTLDAHWSANTVVLSFPNGLPAKTATYGQALPVLETAIYTPVGENGKHFTGYFDAETGGNKIYNTDLSAASQTCTLVANTNLYPQFENTTYNVIFNTNGGSGNMPTGQTVALGGSVTKPATDPSRSGYDFAGWSLYQAVTADVFGDEDTFEVPSYCLEPEGTTFTLYASWTPIVYTVVYDKNGGTGDAPQSSTVRAGAQFGLPEFGTTKGEGVDRTYFGGWNTLANGQGDVYRGTVTFDDTWIAMADNNHTVTLYVNWVRSEFTPAVGYTFTGVQTNGPDETYPLTMTVISLGPTTYRVEQNRGAFQTEVYEFVYGTYPVMNDMAGVIEQIMTGDHTTGTYTINQVERPVDIYTKTLTVHGDVVTIVMKITNDGFVCYLSEDYGGGASVCEYPTHGQRQLQPAEVTYRSGGATPSGEQVRTSSTYVTAEDLGLTKDGYRFAGWGYDLAVFQPGDAITSSRTVTAQWTQIVNPRTNIDWRVYNQPDGIELVMDGEDAYMQNGANGKTITVSGGTNWAYTAQGKVFTFTLNDITYRMHFDDEDNVSVTSNNGQPVITLGEPSDNMGGNIKYVIWGEFYMDLPSFGRYQPTVNDVFVYYEEFWTEQPKDHTLTVTSVTDNKYTYTDDLGQRPIQTSVGTYPAPAEYGITSFQYPDNNVNPHVWVLGQIQYGNQNVDCYVVSCNVYNQNYYSSYSQEMIQYEEYRYYIGVSDGLCYKMMERNTDGILVDTFTLTSKPANMIVIVDYNVTMQFNGGTYQEQSSLVMTLNGPSESIIPENNNYDFVGWALSQDGQVAYAYSNGHFTPRYFQPAHAVAGAITLYAVWEETPAPVYDLVCHGDSQYSTTFSEAQQTITLPTLSQLGCENKPMTRLYFYNNQESYNCAPGETISTSIALSCLDGYDRLYINVFSPYIDVYVNANHQGGDTNRVSQNVDTEGNYRLRDYMDLGDLVTWSGHTATGYAVSADGDKVYDFDTRITPAQIADIYDAENNRITLYLTWTEGDPLIGYLYANYDGADPAYVGAVIPNGGTLMPEDASKIPWTRNGWTATGFNTAADGRGTSYAFGAPITAQAVEALDGHRIYVMWEAANITECRIYGNYDDCDPEYFTVNVNSQTGMVAPSFVNIDNRYLRTDYVPAGLCSTPTQTNESITLYFGQEVDYNTILACNGELYVAWIEIPDVEGILTCTILANYDVQGLNQIPIGNVGELPLPNADDLLSQWDRDGAVPVSLNTRSDGFGTRYELGATLTENDLNSMQRHALYVIWQVEELLGYINANFDGANPEAISGEIDGDLMELPDLEQLPWDRTADGYTVSGFNSASDGSGNDYDLGGDITREQVLALDEHTLYVIWGVTGYIFANTNAEDERYISAVIPTCGMELPSNLPWANPGQVVAYYCTTSDGEGEHYNPGDLIYADDVLSLDSHSLYVIWAAED